MLTRPTRIKSWDLHFNACRNTCGICEQQVATLATGPWRRMMACQGLRRFPRNHLSQFGLQEIWEDIEARRAGANSRLKWTVSMGEALINSLRKPRSDTEIGRSTDRSTYTYKSDRQKKKTLTAVSTSNLWISILIILNISRDSVFWGFGGPIRMCSQFGFYLFRTHCEIKRQNIFLPATNTNRNGKIL